MATKKRYDYTTFNQNRLLTIVNNHLKDFSKELAKYGNKKVKSLVSNKYLRKITGALWRNTEATEQNGKIYFSTLWYGIYWNEDKQFAYSKVGKRKQPEVYLKRYNKLKKTRGHIDPKWKNAKKRPFLRDAIKLTTKRAYTILKKLKRGRAK